jgi:hypothetical protein
MDRMKRYGVPFLVGFCGVALCLVLWHLGVDHWQHHQVWQLELNRAAAAQAAQPGR